MAFFVRSVVALLLLAACGSEPPPAPERNESTAAPAPVAPPAPGTPGGLPGDRTPVSEAPFAETSAQGAAQVVQSYYALIEQRRFAEARALWAGGGEASGMDAAAFARSFDAYAEYHAQIGAPGAIEGAAGSLYVEVPVVLYGRLRRGADYHASGNVQLRRVNDVPGSTAAERRWHVHGVELR